MIDIQRTIDGFGGTRPVYTDEQKAAINAFVSGRKSFGNSAIDALTDEFGCSVGLAMALIKAEKEYRAAQIVSRPLTQAQRIERHLRENRIPLRGRN